MIYAITHAERESGPNPGHTRNGFVQLAQMAKRVAWQISPVHRIPLVIVGRGRTFEQVYAVLQREIPPLGRTPVRRIWLYGGPRARDNGTKMVPLGKSGHCADQDFLGFLWLVNCSHRRGFLVLSVVLSHRAGVISMVSSYFPLIASSCNGGVKSGGFGVLGKKPE